MRVLLAVLAAAATGVLIWKGPVVRCFFRGHHQPTRHPLGGFRCSECGTAGADMEQMGFIGGSYVHPGPRRRFSRDSAGGYSESTVSTEWSA